MEVAVEVNSDHIWIEKMVIATTSKLNRAQCLREMEPQVDEPRASWKCEMIRAIQRLDITLSMLENKLPPEVFVVEDGLRIDDGDVVTRLIHDAKELLCGKLSGVGGRAMKSFVSTGMILMIKLI